MYLEKIKKIVKIIDNKIIEQYLNIKAKPKKITSTDIFYKNDLIINGKKHILEIRSNLNDNYDLENEKDISIYELLSGDRLCTMIVLDNKEIDENITGNINYTYLIYAIKYIEKYGKI